MAQDRVEIRTNDVGLLIRILELLKNKDYLEQPVLGPKESLNLTLDLEEKKLLQLTISKNLKKDEDDKNDRDRRIVSIDRSSDDIHEQIVVVYDHGQQFMNSIKSIKEAIKNKLAEIKKDIENSVK